MSGLARLLVRPSPLVLGAAAGAGAAVAGLPLAAAAGIGAGAWAAGVAVVLGRRPAGAPIDPFAVGEPWRHFVRDALQAQARFRRTVGTVPPGPLRDRLDDIGARVDGAVAECWRIARHGHAIDRALRDLSPSLPSQAATAARLTAAASDARDRLRLVDARLDEAAARAAELALGRPDGAADAAGLSRELEAVVSELESLRLALEEVEGPATPGEA